MQYLGMPETCVNDIDDIDFAEESQSHIHELLRPNKPSSILRSATKRNLLA